MTTHSFTVAVGHPLSDDELDRLFEAGGDDTAPEVCSSVTLVHFDREAPSLEEAILSAFFTLSRAGLTVAGVTAPDPAEAA
jgi:hypothetical protein